MAEPTATGATILIASDNVPDAAMVQRLLGDDFGHILTSASGIEALSALRNTQPDLILMDIMWCPTWTAWKSRAR